MGVDVDALDQQLNDAGLLGRKRLISQRIERVQRVADLRLSDSAVVLLRLAPGPHHDLQRAQQRADLVDHRFLDLAGRNTADRAGLRPALQDGLRYVIPILIERDRRLPSRAGRWT